MDAVLRATAGQLAGVQQRWAPRPAAEEPLDNPVMLIGPALTALGLQLPLHAKGKYNVPVFLLQREQEPERDDAARPEVAYRRLAGRLRKMVSIEVEQFVSGGEPLYSRQVLRKIHQLLGEGEPCAQPLVRPFVMGLRAGMSERAWNQADATMSVVEDRITRPGELLDIVA